MKGFTKILSRAILMGVFVGGFCFEARASAQVEPRLNQFIETPEPPNPYFSRTTIQTEDGKSLEKVVISGPPAPPPGYELTRSVVSGLTPAQTESSKTLTVPAYDWVFGCSAVSAAMIAAYYDNTIYPNMYTGPTNGGVMPANSSGWPTWTDGSGDPYPNNPLIASHQGLDGRTTLGSIDDYWVEYFSDADDPYITGSWVQHAWGDALGDFMKTSQSAYGNVDGSTTFYNWDKLSSPLFCNDMVGLGISTEDGTYGRKLFYEARGYNVTDCYNQKTDNNRGGFTFAMYKAEIDAGRPVFLNLAGHSIVGVGYDDTGSTVYLHDTWDFNMHSMTWGDSYSGMALQSVSIVNLADPLPADFTKISPSNSSTDLPTNPVLEWETSLAATGYEYCIDTSDNSACNDSWVSAGNTTSANLSGLSSNTPYYWQVRATNSTGTTEATGGAWWSFTTGSPTAVEVIDFISSIAYPYGLQLQWSSASEVKTVGFKLYRAETPDGVYLLLNPTLIPAQSPGAMFGNTYTYTDPGAKPGIRYSYKLVHVDTYSWEQDCCTVEGRYDLLYMPLLLNK